MKYTVTLLTVLLTTITSYSQGYNISGMVKNEQDEMLPFAAVGLLRNNDSSIVTGNVTDQNGRFVFEQVLPGKYILKASMIGYNNHFSTLELLDANVETTIIMSHGSEELKEIIVKGRRSRIETELGKTIVNVSKEMKMAKSLLDLLKDVPGVRVSPDGSVSIEGKAGVTILIDDKPVHFTGKSLTEYLRSVDAGKVDKIELMTNPSAKYEAAGNSGILAVKLVKQKDDGIFGGISGNYIQSRYPFYSLNGNINYRKNKLALHYTPSHYNGQGFLIPIRNTTGTDEQTGAVTTILEEDGFWLEEFSDYSNEVGIDYDFTDATTAGLSVKGAYHPNDEVDIIETSITDVATGNEYINLARRERGFVRNNIQANLFLKHELDSNQNIVINGDHFRESRKAYQRIISTDHDANGVPEPEPLRVRNDMPVNSVISSIKADYEGKVGDDIKLEAGVKTSYVTVDDPNKFEVYVDNQWINDTGRTNYYKYDESVSAAYVSSSAKKGKWQAQAGLRVEHTYSKGRVDNTGQDFERNYTSVFPTAYVSYKANDKNTFEVNYGKRIQRPYYREMNPFTLIKSQYAIATGNPYLLPMFSHNGELKHNYRGRFITTLSYSVTNGVFTEIVRFEPDTKVSHYSMTNNGRKTRSALSAYFNKQINDWWGATINARVFYLTYDAFAQGKQVRDVGYGTFARLDTQFTIREKWVAQLSAWYSSPYQSSAFDHTGQSLFTSAQVSKSILHDTGSIRLSVSDPFDIYRYERTTNINGNTVVYDPVMNMRNISLGFSYNFGEKSSSSRKRERLEEAERI